MGCGWLAWAETAVVETVSGDWPQVLSGPEVLCEGPVQDHWLVPFGISLTARAGGA
jgi:hypothetical protein